MENYNIFLSYFHQEIQTPEIVDFSSLQNIAGENLSIDVSANNSSENISMKLLKRFRLI